MNNKCVQSLIGVTALLIALAGGQVSHSQQKSNLANRIKSEEPAVAVSDPNTLDYTTSWIGNSLPGNGTGTVHALQHITLDADSIYATPDGKVYTNTAWDEGGRPVSVFKDGKLISPLNVESNGPNNYSNGGGDAVAADSKYIYKGNTAGGTNGGQGITVLNAADLTPASVSLTGSNTLGNSYAVDGIAIANGKIYVTENDYNVVDVFDQKTLALVTSLSINNPVRIAVDNRGGVWVSHQDQTPYPSLNGNLTDFNYDYGLATVDHFDKTGELINTITLPDGGEVSALWIDNLGYLLVGDEGPDQNIKVYGNILTSPTLVKTLGAKGGVYATGPAPKGSIGPWRFRGITGIATDADENLYVSQNGWGFQHGNGHGLQIQSYNIFGQTNWSVDSLEYASTLDMDPTAENEVYDTYHHFKVDYSQPAGKEATYVADTLNRFLYPDDVRITNITSVAQVQYIQGHKFLLVSNQGGSFLAFYRFEDSRSGPGSEIAIPCAAIDYGSFQGNYQDFDVQPLDGEFIWRDLNGDGRIQMNEFIEPPNNLHRDGNHFWVDVNGDVWQTNYQGENPPYENSIHIRRYLFQGLDSFGAPIYDFDHVIVYSVPTDFPDVNAVNGVQFDPTIGGGVMYVAGGSPAAGAFSQIVRYDNWDRGFRTAKWIINVPFDPDPNNAWTPQSFTQAGKFIFIDFNTPHYTLIYSAEDGSYVGRFTPGADVGGLPNVGNDDEWQGLRAHLLNDGEYILFHEEDYQAKQLMYKWKPPATLTKFALPAAPAGLSYTGDDESVTLNWTGSSDALVYTVSRSSVSGGPYTVVASGVYTTSYTDTNLVNGATYYYVVSSLAPEGTSVNSKELAASTVPYGTTYEAESSVIVGANIYPCSTCSGGAMVGYLVPGTSMTFTVTVATAGTYAVRLYDCNGDSTTPPQDTIGILINNGAQGVSPPLPFTGSYNTPGYVTINMPLNAGSNTIVVGDPATDANGSPNIDRIVVPLSPL